MRGTVLRGEYLRLRRRGGRVRIRVRPHEIVWRTTDSFAVDEIRFIEIQPVELEQRRRRVVLGRPRTRLIKHAVTRLTIRYADKAVSLELAETQAAIVGVFQDLADRLASEGGWRIGRPALQDLHWHPPDDGPEIDLAFERDLDRVFDDDRATPDLVGEAARDAEPRPSPDDWLFPDDEPGVSPRPGVWVRKRKRRAPRFFGRRPPS